ncbi:MULTISPECIES: hypothetical protein [Streptomyces]|uniref:Uncharacterized protein n=1 Tax=Streptomyces solicathayae TaxID=3081768 RepID=A0ABZ0LUK9_9ACTN|nr:hypothetical protein [Streptomyces sp. HUAS YS2]WOX22454.1 hypothetical protein R2D22_14035 [Streptomyces sp. HUAS YS2]
MGFGTYARTVRDERLPSARRHSALRCAVGLYRPLGFHATWAYLAATAVPAPDMRRDTGALLRALDVLEASRAVRLREVAAFAERRRGEKAAGRRTPRAADTAPFRGPRWPGDTAPSRLGLVAAVANRHAAFRRLPPPDDAPLADLHARLDSCALSYLAHLGDAPTPDDSLADALASIRHAPFRMHLLPWLRFADLLVYATTASGQVPRSLG